MKENNYQDALETLNMEYKKLHNSREYRLGKKTLKFEYYLKHFKFITLLYKLIKLREKKYVFTEDKASNELLFKDNELYRLNNYNGEKVAVYTVNIGGYDNLIQPLIKEDNVDYYLVSDKKPDYLGIWKWIDANKYTKDLNLSNVKKARYIKTHPHLIFKNYKYSIFIDGNIRCISNISHYINNINKKTKIAIHPHPYRDCVYKELISLKKNGGKGNYKQMKRQIEIYKKEGMPKLFGLFETNVFIREHNDINCIKIMEEWWNEIYDKSERDQLSFTYVLWKNGYCVNDVGVIYDSIKNNPSVQVVDHLEIYEKELKSVKKD